MRTLLQIYFSMSLTCCFSFVSVLYHGTHQHVVSVYGIASCLLLALYWFLLELAQLPKSMLHISHTAYTICAFYALRYFIYAHTQAHADAPLNELYTHTGVCLCFARISIVCTLCDIFMRPNFVASNLRCVWVTTAVAISLPHLWQIFSFLFLTMVLLFCKPNDMRRKKHTCIY